MKEKLRDWALLAEIVSSLAVLVTLIFLLIELRANSNLTRANAFEETIQGVIEWRQAALSNDDSLQVLTDFFGYENNEETREVFVLLNLWNIYENAYFSREYDLIAEEAWERFTFGICSNYSRDIALWDSRIAAILTPEFREFVPEYCG